MVFAVHMQIRLSWPPVARNLPSLEIARERISLRWPEKSFMFRSLLICASLSGFFSNLDTPLFDDASFAACEDVCAVLGDAGDRMMTGDWFVDVGKG
jgi:hypothetical protein